MVIVKLMGGLGNQMFQYAAGRALSLHHNCEMKFDLDLLLHHSNRDKHFVPRNFELDIFSIPPVPRATEDEVNSFTSGGKLSQLRKIISFPGEKKTGIFKERHFHFHKHFFDTRVPVYLHGYWQSEKYFEAYKNTIRADFTFRHTPSDHIQELAAKIKNCVSVCVNVRRGDFVTNPMHGAMSPAYYAGAAAIIESRFANTQYFIFSDDMEWCKQHLSFSPNIQYVDHEYAGKKFSDYLFLMSNCSHFIIPNSSFGWWAAWLGHSPAKTVIAPQRWFNKGPKDTEDLIPGEWIKIG